MTATPERHPHSEHPPGPAGTGEADSHATTGTYVKVALVLTAVTVIEVAATYIRALTPILIPALLVLSASKFALVVLFFMHLRYDSRILSLLFVGPLLIATVIVLALIALIAATMTGT